MSAFCLSDMPILVSNFFSASPPCSPGTNMLMFSVVAAVKIFGFSRFLI